MPMLEYYPEKRVSAQTLLEHYWLNMPPNFDYTMSEKEYQRMMMIKQNTKKEKPEENNNIDVVESDEDLNVADDEDNEDYNTQDEFEQFSDEEYLFEEEQFEIPNYNNSFAAYGQHVSLSSLDRANPQFEYIDKGKK